MAKQPIKKTLKNSIKKIPVQKPTPKKVQPTAVNRTADVDDFMAVLTHPLKTEMEAIRGIIKNSAKGMMERVKWNAPSFFYGEDLVTFNPRATAHVHLVFHHPDIASVPSPILSGDYKDRRMAYFKDMKEVKAAKKELERIMRELVKRVEKKQDLKK